MELVVNEWLLEFMRPDSETNDLRDTLRFLNTLVVRRDRIVIRRPSPFVDKFYRFMKRFGSDSAFKERFSRLHQLLFVNTDNTRILDDSDVQQIPDELRSKIKPDDIYLVELVWASPDKILITTDRDLKAALSAYPDVKVHLFDEFTRAYFGSRDSL